MISKSYANGVIELHCTNKNSNVTKHFDDSVLFTIPKMIMGAYVHTTIHIRVNLSDFYFHFISLFAAKHQILFVYTQRVT